MLRFLRYLALSCVLSACADRTQLIVVVDSDLEVAGELDQVRVTVLGPSGMSVEATQALDEGADAVLPLTLGVRPASEALGPIEVTAEGQLDGATVVTRTATTSLVRGEVRVLYLFLARSCRGVECADGETCTESGCASAAVDPEDLLPWNGQVPGRDAGGMDAGVDRQDAAMTDGGADGGPPPVACTTGSDCEDGLDCTIGVCTDGVCTHRPDDGLCAAAADGVCDPADGCQYPDCTAATCVAGPCQTAACVGDRCERTNLCGTGEMCCADACVPAGCDDGNACTDDSCGTSGCENVDNDASCDDGTFCNGSDTCSGGSCASHAGSPCSGSAVCDEAMDVCTGCLDDGDCSGPMYGTWSGCGGFADTCDEGGMESRSVTTYSCTSGTCVGSTSTESRSCTRDTDGTACDTTTCGGFGGCGGFSSSCDETGTQSRTCTDYACSAGTCASSTRTESTGCSRSTDGMSCGSTTCGSYGSCGGFSETCDETGTETRTCTDYECASGTCDSSSRTESRSCSRDTDGMTCQSTLCTGWSTCSGFSTACDQTGTQSRSCTAYECVTGSCSGSASPESRSCSRSTNGDPCNDGRSCTFSDQCSSGFCSGTDICGGGCVCDPSGACIDPGSPMMICPIVAE